jgi:hypothetical protein
MGESQNKFVHLTHKAPVYLLMRYISGYKTRCVCELEVMIEIEGPNRHVYIKLSDPSRMQDLLTSTTGHTEYRYTNGVISKARIEAMGLELRKVRIANIPPEVSDR